MRIPFFIIAALLVASNAPAQSRGSAAAVVGAGNTWDDESKIGSGVAAGGRLDGRLFGNTRAEIAIDYLAHDRRGGFFEANGHTVLTSLSLAQRFGNGTAQPYVLGGLTFTHHSGTTTFSGLTRRPSGNGKGYHFGGGLAVTIGQRDQLGPEARFYIIDPTDSSGPAWAYWFGARFGVKF